MTNQPNPPYVELKVLEDGYSVAPGEKVDIPIILVNQGQQPEQVRIGVEGIPLFWVSTKQQVVLLQPGEKTENILTVQPPGPPQRADRPVYIASNRYQRAQSRSDGPGSGRSHRSPGRNQGSYRGSTGKLAVFGNPGRAIGSPIGADQSGLRCRHLPDDNRWSAG